MATYGPSHTPCRHQASERQTPCTPSLHPTPTRPSQPCTAHVWPRLARARAYGASRAAGDRPDHAGGAPLGPLAPLWAMPGRPTGHPARDALAALSLTRSPCPATAHASACPRDGSGAWGPPGPRGRRAVRPSGDAAGSAPAASLQPWSPPVERVRGALTKPQVPGLRGVPRAFRDYLGDPQSLRVS